VLIPLTRIDHIGIACVNLEERISFYESTFGYTVVGREANEAQGIREAMLKLPDAPAGSPYIQLFEPLRPDSTVARFIARRGQGMHHIGYGVTDIAKAMAALDTGGLELVYKRPMHGFMGSSITFVHPSSVGGVLTELVQTANQT
jgi:methylmalonyl-CoA/ethylmalonyl-CoA epimerase